MYRLLIIEDDNGIAEAVKQQAEMWDLQVQIAENFRGIMAEFAGFDPHIVLLDISLPFFNGYHCLMENKGRVVSREKLMEQLWETDSFVDENTLSDMLPPRYTVLLF